MDDDRVVVNNVFSEDGGKPFAQGEGRERQKMVYVGSGELLDMTLR